MYCQTISPYGAAELKMSYQRNMMLAMLMVVTLVGLAIVSVYLIYNLNEEIIQIPIDPKPIEIDIELVKPPIIAKPKPKTESRTKAKPLPIVPAQIIPVDDELIEDEGSFLLATKEELYEIVGSANFGEGLDGGDFMVVVPPEDDFYTSPTFEKCEIKPVMIQGVQPDYPRQARLAGIEATVVVKALVDENGDVIKAEIKISSGSKAGFDEAALKAAMKCKFKPGIQNGIPVKVWTSFRYDFELNN